LNTHRPSTKHTWKRRTESVAAGHEANGRNTNPTLSAKSTTRTTIHRRGWIFPRTQKKEKKFHSHTDEQTICRRQHCGQRAEEELHKANRKGLEMKQAHLHTDEEPKGITTAGSKHKRTAPAIYNPGPR
jgi:hypothetical protein